MLLRPILDHDQQSSLPESVTTEPERDIRAIRACLIALVVIAFLALCTAAADLLAPTAIAIMLALVLAPVTNQLEKFWLPSGLAAVLTVGVTVAGITFAAATTLPSVTEWIRQAPEIVHAIDQKLRPIKRQLLAVESASQQITRMTSVPSAPQPQQATTSVTGGILSTVVNTAPNILAKLVYVTVLTIFLLAFRQRYTEQLILTPRRYSNRIRMARICRDVRNGVSGYLFTLAMINVGLASVTALVFMIAGIRDAVLWGLAFGFMNFIPIVGPTAVILAAAVVSFASSNTILDAILPPSLLLGLNAIEANLVQPWLLSYRIVVNPVVIFVTVAGLVWMWGIAAAITAVPALILFHAVAQHVPSLRPVAGLLAVEGRNGGSATGNGQTKNTSVNDLDFKSGA